jgi:uncharacterized membrane protein
MFFAPFLALYSLIFFFVVALLFVFLEIGIIHYAFGALGLPPQLAFIALLASLAGSYINIPIARVDGGRPHDREMIDSFGVRYRVPARYVDKYTGTTTTLAVNVGGAVVPVLISIYVLVHQMSTIMPAAFAVVLVAVLVHRWARPVPGLGIAIPMFIPPVIAALTAWLLASLFDVPNHVDAVAYVGGVLGTLIGADIANLGNLGELGAPVASIGGAGTFDGVFLTGIVAVLLA